MSTKILETKDENIQSPKLHNVLFDSVIKLIKPTFSRSFPQQCFVHCSSITMQMEP